MSDKTRPPLKWAGGKFQILEQIKKRLPAGERLIEPFAGSGAVFLNTDFKRYTLNDCNPDLINFYKWLKKERGDFIDYCRQFFTPKYNNADVYYRLRERFNAAADGKLKAALFLYLNRHSYNGLCRYNAAGHLNVPFGKYERPCFPERALLIFARKSRYARLQCRDFEQVITRATPNDVIYCDPPYAPRSRTANFTDYYRGGFGIEQQIRLARAAAKAAGAGVSILISNHANRVTKDIYRDATCLHHFNVRRTISCHGHKRERARELLAVYLPPEQA